MPADRPEGTFQRGTHLFPVRVYYEDTDAGGFVYHANYLRFAERARTEILRGFGMRQSQLAAENGVLLVVHRCTADFFAPARLDDSLVVVSRLLELRGASVDLEQTVRRGGTDLVRLQVELACMSNGRAARLPAPVRAALAEFAGNIWSDDGKQRG